MPDAPPNVPSSLVGAVAEGDADPRAIQAWRAWLGALASDAQAALAAAIAYRSLEAPGRDRWLAALEHDLTELHVPPIAVYAPLLAVEGDVERRDRILSALGNSDATPASTRRIALQGQAPDGVRIAAIVSPLYLDFVQVLACGFRRKHGFFWVRHDPIALAEQAPACGQRLEGAVLEAVPLSCLIDDLAYAVLAQRRAGRPLPDALAAHADLFDAKSQGVPLGVT